MKTKGNEVKILDRGNTAETVLSLNGEIVRDVTAYRVQRAADTLIQVTFTINVASVELLGEFTKPAEKTQSDPKPIDPPLRDVKEGLIL